MAPPRQTSVPVNDPGRDALVAAIFGFLGARDLLAPDDIRAALEREIDEAGPAALLTLKARLAADLGWEYYPRDALARRLHHLLADRFLRPESQLLGGAYLADVGDAPVAMFANHLSYADANVIEVLVERSGGAALAGRLTAMAGPKVFTSRERRFSSLCFGTIKVPQSAEVSSGEAALTAREVARAARHAIEVARERLRQGDALLLFGEGTRSRTGTMQPMLPSVARYLDVPGLWVVPAGLSGTEVLFAPGEVAPSPARVSLQIGRPFRADALAAGARGDRRVIVDAIGLAVAALVPPSYRGVYGEAADFPEAREALRDTTSSGQRGGS